MKTTISNSPSEGTTLVVDLYSRLKRDFGVIDPPPVSTLRVHAYNGKFPYVRLPSGKLAVQDTDIPAIAAMYAPNRTSAAA